MAAKTSKSKSSKAKAKSPKAKTKSLKAKAKVKSPKVEVVDKAAKAEAKGKSPTSKSTKKKRTPEAEETQLNMFKTGLDEELVKKAVHALVQYHEKKAETKSDLLGNEDPVQVQITLLRPPGEGSPKPIRIPIPHSFHRMAGSNDVDVCIIVKEDSKPAVQKMVERFPEQMGCIKKVLGLQSLRNKHSQFQQRRELLQKYDLFMADDRILPMIGKAIGANFFKAKKQPIPVSVARTNSLPFAIQNVLESTFMSISTGTSINIRAGFTNMHEDHLVENIASVVKNAATKVPHKWANVQAISIKTPESMALPIYNKTPEALLEIGRMAGIETPVVDKGNEKKTKETIDTPDQEEEEEEVKEKVETESKQKRKEESPLVRALKKQKKDKETKKDSEKTTKKKKSSKSTEKKKSK